jgi:hypothetical protein
MLDACSAPPPPNSNLGEILSKDASLENSPATPAIERMRFRSDATPGRAITLTPNRRRLVCGLTWLGTLVLCVAHISSARADSASCLAKLSSYVAELDELFGREKKSVMSIIPYTDLNERYFPFRDCEPDALLEIVRSSRFVRSITHDPRTNKYFIHFSDDQVRVGLFYNASEKKSDPGPNTVRWMDK